jgi:hypothetical protein
MIDPVRRGRAVDGDRGDALSSRQATARAAAASGDSSSRPSSSSWPASPRKDISTSSSSSSIIISPGPSSASSSDHSARTLSLWAVSGSSEGARSASPEASSHEAPGPSSCPDIEKRWRVWRRGIGVIPSATGSDVRKVAALGLPKRTPFARVDGGAGAPTPRRELASGRDRRLRMERLGVRVRCFGTTFSVCGEYA